MAGFYNYNGKLYEQGQNFISPDNRGFRYGDGLFETMIVNNQKIRLATLHFERLFAGLGLLKFEIPKLFTAVSSKCSPKFPNVISDASRTDNGIAMGVMKIPK